MYCNECICAACFGRHVLINKRECALCLHEIPMEFIQLHTSKAVRRRLFDKLAAQLIEDELNAPEIHAERVRVKGRHRLKTLRRTKSHLIVCHLQACTANNNNDICKELYTRVRGVVNDITKEIEEIENTLDDIEGSLERFGEGDETAGRSSASFMHCVVDACTGIVVRGACTDCHALICTKCQQRITSTDDHACNKDDVASIAFIKSDTKPCPKCRIHIHKISGCDQMFCVKCHVLFSWKTGNIHRTGVRHNPHYFDWLRNQTAGEEQLQNIDCGGDVLINVEQAVLVLNRMRTFPSYTSAYMLEAFDNFYLQRVLNESRNITAALRRLAYDTTNHENKKRKLRERYLLNGNNDKSSWKQGIITFLKRIEMYKDLISLVSTFERIIEDAILSMWGADGSIKLDAETLSNLEHVIKTSKLFMDEHLEHIQDNHKLSPQITLSTFGGISSAYH